MHLPVSVFNSACCLLHLQWLDCSYSPATQCLPSQGSKDPAVVITVILCILNSLEAEIAGEEGESH